MVVPVELTDIAPGPQPLPDTVGIVSHPGRTNIRRRGANLTVGDTAVPAGTVIDAGTLAALISAGVPTVSVHRTPRVAVISSGEELASHAPGSTAQLSPGKLPDSNGPMVEALVRACLPQSDAPQVTLAHSRDEVTALRDLLDTLAPHHDLIITTGGVSAGAFDVVHATLGEASPDSWFGHVAHKPGAPQGMSRWGETPVLSLPGNPVAAFVSFHMYVAPALRVLRGIAPPTEPGDRPHLLARAAAEFPAARPGRTNLVPVSLEWGGQQPVAVPFTQRNLGSHMVASLAGTHGIAVIDSANSADSATGAAAATGDTVRVLLY